jgi:hypothetical protein
MLFDEGDEVRGRVAGEGGFGEVRIGGEEILRRAVKIGEVGAATAGDEDFAAEAIGAFEKSDATAAFAAFGGTEETGGAGAEDEDIELADGVGDGGKMVAEVEGGSNGARELRTSTPPEEKADPSPAENAGFGMVAGRYRSDGTR